VARRGTSRLARPLDQPPRRAGRCAARCPLPRFAQRPNCRALHARGRARSRPRSEQAAGPARPAGGGLNVGAPAAASAGREQGRATVAKVSFPGTWGAARGAQQRGAHKQPSLRRGARKRRAARRGRPPVAGNTSGSGTHRCSAEQEARHCAGSGLNRWKLVKHASGARRRVGAPHPARRRRDFAHRSTDPFEISAGVSHPFASSRCAATHALPTAFPQRGSASASTPTRLHRHPNP